MKFGNLLILVVAILGLAETAVARDKLNAIELATLAETLFAPEVAETIQKEINLEVNAQTGPFGSESFATLFLADNFYKKIGTGKFLGKPVVIWNGVRDGKPIFFFPQGDFTYITESGRQISPQAMDTDGGSVPKLLHSVGSFDPWTYGPAFLIHDWIFIAHKCSIAPENDIDFESSALIMAEAIKTLMEVGYQKIDGGLEKLPKREDTMYLMYLAVRSPVAKGFWDNLGSVNC